MLKILNDMIKRLLFIITIFLFSISLNAQGYWKLESKTNDYTMEKEYFISHYTRGLIDAIYFINEEQLKIIRDYKGLTYFDACWNAAIYNDGRIDDYTGTIYCRLINSGKDYEEFELDDMTISYDGYAGDGKIDTNGFFSYFYVGCKPEQLKRANYITFQYYDKISEQTISRKISLAGFTKAYNSIRH